MVRIVFVRHGETEANSSGQFQFPEDPLTPNGRKQADLVGRRIAADTKRNPRIILASPYSRALDTALAIQKHVNENDHADEASLIIMDKLHERNFGIYRGKSYNDVVGAGIKILSNKHDVPVPEGESTSEFNSRVEAAFEEMMMHAKLAHGYNFNVLQHNPEMKEYEICVVSHGLVMKQMMKILDQHVHESQPKKDKIPIDPGRLIFWNTSVTIVDVEFTFQELFPNGKDFQVRFSEVFNCVEHLEQANVKEDHEHAAEEEITLLKPKVHL